MIKKFTHLGNAALGVCAGAFALSLYLGKCSSTASIWGPGGAPELLVYVVGASVFLVFWAYAKSKGRSGWLGLVLPWFNVLGLVILLRLEDRSGQFGERLPDAACPQCAGKNAAADATCRYCNGVLGPAGG